MRQVRRVIDLMVLLARELADEGGYRRYLERSGKHHSPAVWRGYIDGRQRAKFGKPKCC